MADAKISSDSSVSPSGSDTVAGLQSGGNVQFSFANMRSFFVGTPAAGRVLAGSVPDFTATPTLGASGTLGTIAFGNATSGTITLGPVSGALGSVTLSLPAATDTLVGKATTDTLTNKTLTSPVINGVTHTTGTATTTGYQGIPQNSNSANYLTVLSDAGKCIYHPVGDNNARTFTIDGSVAYPVGTVIVFINMAAAALSIAVSTDTMTLAGTTTTGTRTLAQNGIASAYQDTSSTWLISGTGLT